MIKDIFKILHYFNVTNQINRFASIKAQDAFWIILKSGCRT